MSNSDYKREALKVLKGNWTPSVLATIIVTLVLLPYVALAELPGVLHVGTKLMGSLSLGAFLYMVFVGYPVEVSYDNAIRHHIMTGDSGVIAKVWHIFCDHWLHLCWGYLLLGIKIFLWTLLLVIPGIIKAFSYAMTPFILVEFPELSASQAIQLSRKIMSGRKFDLFYLYLSFIGWFFLCILTLGIGFLWLVPYTTGAVAAFYNDAKEQYFLEHPVVEDPVRY